MSDEQRIEGAKRVVLVDCEDVVILRGKHIQVDGVDQLHISGCIGATADLTTWDSFNHNHVLDGGGNTFDVPRRVLAMSKAESG